MCPNLFQMWNIRYFKWLIISSNWWEWFFLRSLLFDRELLWPEWLTFFWVRIHNLYCAKLFRIEIFDRPHLVVTLRLLTQRLGAVHHLEFPWGLVFIITGRRFSWQRFLIFSRKLRFVFILTANDRNLGIHHRPLRLKRPLNRFLVFFSQFLIDKWALTVRRPDGPLGILIVNLYLRGVLNDPLVETREFKVFVLLDLMVTLPLFKIVYDLFPDQIDWLGVLSPISPTTFHI